MKKLLIMMTAFTISSGVFAQDNMGGMKMKHKSKSHSMHHGMKDCVMMKDGKMMMMKNGKTMDMTEDMTMSNGMVCMKDGTCKMKDGTTMTMKNGEKCTMDGKMMGMKMGKTMKMKM